ncbi:MAG: ParB N-terminal domain-containing protein [Nitrospira sp.]|jgi:ParB-like chromosome segregation protein Spo0J|nr:ParB N-terminal domain-containing protein [Nitrospira sp.]
MQIVMIPTSQIQVHEEYATLFPPLTALERDILKSSIQEAGIHDALRVERLSTDKTTVQTYVLLAGHHRLSIAKELKITEVPCIIVTTLELKVAALFDNLHRRQLPDNLLQQMQNEERRYRATLRERLIPEILDVLPILPPEVQLQLTQSSQDRQREFITKWLAQVQHVQSHCPSHKTPEDSVALDTDRAKTSTPAAQKQLIRKMQHVTKECERRIAQQSKELEELQGHNVSLSRQLRMQADDNVSLREQLESLQRQITNQDLDHKAERILKLRHKRHPQNRTIDEADPLITGLTHTRTTAELLLAYARCTVAPPTTAQATLLEHISLTIQVLKQLQQIVARPTDMMRTTSRATLAVHEGHSTNS